jgi:hypothetical protein
MDSTFQLRQRKGLRYEDLKTITALLAWHEHTNTDANAYALI